MHLFVLSLAAFLTFALPQDTALPASTPCTFNASRNAPLATINGADDIVQRVQMLAQPGSPIVITTLDLSDTKLVVGPGSYEHTGAFTIEVMNVSDRPVSDIQVAIRVSQGKGGSGTGTRVRKVLQPGERARETVRHGRGHGSGDYAEEDVIRQAFVEEALLDGCRYRPALAMPAGR